MTTPLWRVLTFTRPAGFVCALLVALAGGLFSHAGERAPLRRGLVPADRTATWPAGDWQRVPYAELREFVRDYETDAIPDQAPPLIDRLVFRGTLDDSGIIEGRFEGRVRKFSARPGFLALDQVTPAISAVQWSDRPAVWGSDPEGTVLLYVDRDTDEFSGRWSQRGEEILGGREFDLRVFPAASIRIELTLPEAYELQSSRGVVLPPDSDRSAGQVWGVELGQQSASLITVVPKSDRPPIVSMAVERAAAWSIRPDGCRLQVDFNISIPASSPATLEFTIPDDLQNPEVTSTSNVSLPAEVDRRSMPPRLVVPLPRLASGRLGIIRVSGDLPLRLDENWTFPEIRLENSTVVSSVRRLHIDRPLKLQSLDMSGLRQTGMNVDDSGGDWTFEDTSPEAQVQVRVSRPPSVLMLAAATLIETSQNEARFQTAAELIARSGGDYRAELWLPTGWNVIEVGTPSGDRSAVNSWQTSETDAGVRLEIEFRQSLSSQLPRQVIISGRRIGGLDSTGEIELFPAMRSQGESRLWLGVRSDGLSTAEMVPRRGVQAFDTSGAPPEWTRLVALLEFADRDGEWSWFAQSDSRTAGAIAREPATTGNPVSPASQDGMPPSVGAAPDAGDFAMDLILETGTGGADSPWIRHRARFVLSGRRPDDPPKIQMPAGSQIDGLAIDGQPQDVVTAGETLELLEWPAAPRIIEVRYRTRNQGGPHWLSRPLNVVLPAWDLAPRSLEWRLHSPRTERLADVRIPSSAVVPRPESGWMSRLFGPLGRDDWQQTANPFSAESWRRRLRSQEQPAATTAGVVTIRTLLPEPTLRVELVNLPNLHRAGWLAILGSVLIAALLRIWSRRTTAVLWLAGCLLLVGVGLLPYVAATLCGGALTGILIGVLLPRRWITSASRAVSMPARHSDLTRVGAAIGAVLLLLIAWQDQLRAQPAPAPQSDTVAAPAAGPAPLPFDVLVPEIAGDPDEFALIQRRLLPLFEQWRRSRHHDPAYLVQSARYAVELTEPPQVHARYTVAVFDERPWVPLTLPIGRLSVRDPDACRVNGAAAQIRPAIASSALLIDVPGRDLDAETPARIAEVELTLQLGAAARAGTGWEFDVPTILDTEVLLPAAAVQQGLTTASEFEDAAADGLHVFRIGGRPAVTVSDESGRASINSEPLTAEAVSLIEVHPLRLRVRTSLLLAPAPPTGSTSGSRRLRLLLPEQADVREVAVGGLRSYAVRHPQRDTTLVELELDHWPAPDAGIHLDYTLPVRHSADGIVIPPIPLLRDSRLGSHRLGLRAGPGMSLEPPPTSRLPASLHELPAEMFSAGLSSQTAWPIPSYVYVATAPASLTVNATPLTPQKSVALEQTIQIGEDTLQWQATADVEIALAPAFQHEFELPESVELSAVSLVDQGVQRLLDWSHVGDRLVLFLPGERIGPQKVRLAGTIRFRSNVVTPFPVLTMRDAETTSSELFIQSAPAQRFELFAADGSPLPPVAAGVAAETMQFTQQDAELPSAFRTLPAPDPLSISLVTTFQREGTGWRLLTRIIPARPLASGESVQISLPTEIGAEATAVAPALIHRADAGTFRLLPPSGGADVAVVPLEFGLPVDVPERGVWTAPRVSFLNATVTDEYAVVPPEFPLTPSAAASELQEPPASLNGLPQRSGPHETSPNAPVYRWTDRETIFVDRSLSDGVPDIRHVETTVWNDAHSAAGGEAIFWMIARQSRCDLAFAWPADVELRGAIWDGRPVKPDLRTDAQLAFRIDGLSPGSLHSLTIAWHDSRGTSGGSEMIWRPKPGPATTAPEFATILPRDGFFLLPAGGQPPRSEILKRRAESLLNLASIVGAGSAKETTAALAGQLDAALKALELASPAAAKGLRARFDESVRAFPQLETAAGHQSGTDDQSPPSLSVIASRDSAALPVKLADSKQEITYWELHAGLSAAAACLAGLLLFALCLRFRSVIQRAADWIPISPSAIGVLALGTFWWTWLKFGAVGLLLIFAAAVLSRQARNHASPENSVSRA